MKHIKDSSVGYPTDLTPAQAILLKANLEDALSRQRKHVPEAIINAISYVLKTGCQWSMLPKDFPNWKTVYHHFRSLSERGWFSRLLRVLVEGQRESLGQFPEPFECVIDSRSVRSALSDSQKGVDGNKRIKGIKRHIAVESNGYVLEVNATPANIHDSKGAIPLICKILEDYRDVSTIKADLGYEPLKNIIRHIDGIYLDCVKSNFGTPDFIPIQGRWVVERTFSWMENYRRLTRNYARLLKVGCHMFIVAGVFFMLRYFA